MGEIEWTKEYDKNVEIKGRMDVIWFWNFIPFVLLPLTKETSGNKEKGRKDSRTKRVREYKTMEPLEQTQVPFKLFKGFCCDSSWKKRVHDKQQKRKEQET